jgi:hypothetical protein
LSLSFVWYLIYKIIWIKTWIFEINSFAVIGLEIE